MHYVNFSVSDLSGPTFMRATTADNGVWLRLIRYCCLIENNGVIANARSWVSRDWLIACAVSLEELNSNCGLWEWDNNDLRVNYYPTWVETKIKRQRQAASQTNHKRWKNRKSVSDSVSESLSDSLSDSVSDSLTESVNPSCKVSKVRKGKVRKGCSNARARGKNKSASPGLDLKTQWAATRAELQRLEELESASDGQLPAEEARELSRLRQQLQDITRQQAAAAPGLEPRKGAAA